MFFFIGGVSPRTITLNRQARICSNCGHLTLFLKRTDHYFSLFLVPLFPVKRGEPFLSCEGCGANFDEHGEPRFQHQPSRERTCRHCARPVGSDFIYCPYCGNLIES